MTTRHSYQDALGERDFQLLLEGSYALDEIKRLETRFCILCTGRLGLRAGELAHIHEDWVNWDRSMIDIPQYYECDCGYCRGRAKQKTDWNDISFEAAMKERWKPKTDKSVRSVPFDFSPRVELVMERFFNEYNKWPFSKQTINRRVKSAAEKAQDIDSETTYPHCLRATAATYHASRGLEALQLQTLLGWADVETARKYVRLTGEHTARALRNAHNR